MNKTKILNLFGTNKIISIIILIIVIVVIVLTVRQYTGANTDRICSRAVSSESQCSNGSWSGWTIVSQGADSTTESRTYTGTRGIHRTIQFRTSIHNYSCSIGGGNVTLISEVAVCQVIETRVTTSGEAGEAGGAGGSGSEVGTDELEPVTITTTTSESTSPTTKTVTESVVLRTIEADFMCSLNKEDWKDCREEIKVAKRSTPIYLKSFVEDATSWTWFIENNNKEPLTDGQSIGTLQNPNSETTRMNLKYGAGNKFVKEVTLNVKGKDRFGLSGSGSVTETLNITVVDVKYIEI
ncbi:MAG: hypothetical protein QGH85_02060 [Candidatus Pacebacteria bacterium]|jgi:hypothetical protein|nr:hypothetical protein [Parcubacteria group bacterium]MDP7466384.1 hypothetical protein [Candidatus Paceibacterota bacterium]MDP7648103.1 hypothetical protein [Candidatus Paceibacterota bacterium]|tara:strand:- start:3822 stop:4709 length:888 start_codon:yes stop_codon:yes gene_type:complete